MYSENNKRIAKNTLLLYFRMLLMMVISLYTSRVILSMLGISDFGIYNVVGGIVTMFSFLNISMSRATQRFMSFEIGKNNKNEFQKVFSISVSIHVIISFIILILAETVGLWFLKTQMNIPTTRLEAAMWVYQFSIFTSVVMILSVPYNSAIIAHEKMGAFAYISILEAVLKLIIVYLLALFSFDKLKIYAGLIFTVQLLIQIVYSSYCKRKFDETNWKFIWDKKLFKEMISFAGWTMNGNIAYLAFTQGLNILLNIFFGPVVNAARGIAVQVQGAVSGFSSNFQASINPQIVKYYAANDFIGMHKLIFLSSKFSYFLLLLLSLPIIIETDFILDLWLKNVPEYTASFVRLTLFISLISSLADPMIIAAHSTGKIKKYQIWESSVLLLILPFAYISLKLGYRPESVFVVHLIIAIITQYVRLRIVSSMIDMKIGAYVRKVVLSITYVSVIVVILSYSIYNLLPEGITGFILNSLFSALSVLFSIFIVGLDKSEKIFVTEKLLKIIMRVSKRQIVN